jgi:hypothetical protein
MKRLVIFDDGGDSAIYSIRVGKANGRSHSSVYFSRVGGWSSPIKGKRAVRIYENGDGYDVTVYNPFRQDSKSIFLDYCEIEELVAALSALPGLRRMRSARLK